MSIFSKKESARALKYTAAVLLLTLGAQLQAEETLDQRLAEKGALLKAHFLELCKANVVEGKRPAPSADSCLMYFHALRDGYIGGQRKAIDRAVVYYTLKGEVPPAAELDMNYLRKGLEGTNMKAHMQLEAHATRCVKSIPTQKLLEEFYTYVQHTRPLWHMSDVFDEFAQYKYAGKCKGGELVGSAAPAQSLTPTPVGKPTEAWHGAYKMKMPDNMPEGLPPGFELSFVITFGDEGFSVASSGKEIATGTYDKKPEEIILHPRWGQFMPDGTRMIIESDTMLQMDKGEKTRFEKLAK